MKQEFIQHLMDEPLIAAIKSADDLDEALKSPVTWIFLLGGNICDLKEVIEASRAQGKKLFVHIDLLEGIGRDYYALKFLKDSFNPDGIITTRTKLVKFAKECGIFVIQRIFMLDSKSFDMGLEAIKSLRPDAVEIMPGILPGVISQMKEICSVPIIAGGLIRTKQEAIECLRAGAMGVSTSAKPLWCM